MDELLIWLVVGFFKLIFTVVRGFFRLIKRGLSSLSGAGESGKSASEPTRVLKGKQAKPAVTGTLNDTPKVLADLLPRAQKLIDRTAALAATANKQGATLRFVPTLDELASRTDRILVRLKRSDGKRDAYLRDLARDEALLEIVDVMVSERRGPLQGLLGDTDALASSAYAPIVEFCRNRGIPLSSDRAVTMVGGDKLFFLSVDDPSGLAAIVLPDDFTRSIVTWPAIAHEIAHDFFRSVTGLSDELRASLRLGTDLRASAVVAARVDPREVAERSTAAWMEELFADAFGTMMMGPAYVRTMVSSFASPDEPARALAMMPVSNTGVPTYEEHPPGHVRVIVGCRLLSRMGYGKVADELEANWRKRHGNPAQVYAPTADKRWVSIAEDVVVARAATVGETLYMTGLPSLRGQPLRSIAGLDFGPREHQRALRIAERLGKGQPVRTADARVLVAGAVLATAEVPARAADIYALAREAIVGIDVPRTAGIADAQDEGPLGTVDGTALREAFILDELLRGPVSRRNAH